MVQAPGRERVSRLSQGYVYGTKCQKGRFENCAQILKLEHKTDQCYVLSCRSRCMMTVEGGFPRNVGLGVTVNQSFLPPPSATPKAMVSI